MLWLRIALFLCGMALCFVGGFLYARSKSAGRGEFSIGLLAGAAVSFMVGTILLISIMTI